MWQSLMWRLFSLCLEGRADMYSCISVSIPSNIAVALMIGFCWGTASVGANLQTVKYYT